MTANKPFKEAELSLPIKVTGITSAGIGVIQRICI